VQPLPLLQAATCTAPTKLPNLLPLCCPTLGEHDTLDSLSSQLQLLLQQLVPYSGMSEQQVLAAAGLTSSSTTTTHNPLFQAGLVVASEQQGGLPAAAAAAAAASLDLALLLILPAGPASSGNSSAPRLHLLYNSGLFYQHSAELLAPHFKVRDVRLHTSR
jgi:hypothetical protein